MDAATGQTLELLQVLIRNACVNDGTPESGQEVRNADTLEGFLSEARRSGLRGTGYDLERFEPAPGRVSLVARIEGSDPEAPSLCLMGHTDVVPVNPEGWTRDPFGGELVDGEVWGRGAVDMLNLTAAQAVAFRRLAESGFTPRGDLIFFAVADEEHGSLHGAHWMAEHETDAIRADYVLTENGGLHTGPPGAPAVAMNVGEKGIAWRRLTVRGTPGHGSMPFRKDNALVKAAAVAQRIADYRPPPRFHELWYSQVAGMGLPDEMKEQLLDPGRIDEFLESFPSLGAAGHLHACTHTTFSVNNVEMDGKTNVIPDRVVLDVDIRTLPGEDDASVQAHLDAALGDLTGEVEVSPVITGPATISRIDTPLWDSLQRATNRHFPDARLTAQFIVGATDAKVFRELGAVAYGAGLLSPDISSGDFASRFHGNDERIDLESLRLTGSLYEDVARDLLGR
ncbi:MAG: M20/M25/M40 family metallo-hydrolase [Acidimicrobiales bacterium]|nr:M20/M25/M40 family metallo-hydrolase [Acidimicrobiales bacterium]